MVQLERKLKRAKSDTCTSLYHTVQLLTTAVGFHGTSPNTSVQFPSAQDVLAPRYTPLITRGLNHTRHISKPQASFYQEAQPGDRAWH